MRNRSRSWQVLAFALSIVVSCCHGATAQENKAQENEIDWPQWRGPDRTDTAAQSGLLGTWPANGPTELWQFDHAGQGYAGFSVVGDRLYTLGAEKRDEFALCLDINTGKEIWRTTIGKRFKNGWGDGPRSTPTIHDGLAYFMPARGNVSCLNIDDGAIVWSQDLTEFGGSIPTWGYSESILIDNGNAVCTPGGGEGALIAFDAKTGKRQWQSTLFTEPAHYSSIIIADHPKKRHYVQLTPKVIVGIDPENGSVLWRHEFPGRTAVIPTPIYHDQKVYVTAGYGAGSTQIDISDLNSPKEVWFSKAMKNHHGGVILLDGHLYGHSDRNGWVCQSWESGKKVWAEKKQFGKGAIGYADGHFYLLAEKSGDVVLIDASSDGWLEKGRFRISPQSENRSPQGAIWVHPVVCKGRLFLRDQEKIYCYHVGDQ